MHLTTAVTLAMTAVAMALSPAGCVRRGRRRSARATEARADPVPRPAGPGGRRGQLPAHRPGGPLRGRAGVAALWLTRAPPSWSWPPPAATGPGRRAATRRSPAAAGPGRRWQPWLFGAGLATVAVALVSPLDGRAHASLTAHMVQHVLLLAVAAAPAGGRAPRCRPCWPACRGARPRRWPAHGWASVQRVGCGPAGGRRGWRGGGPGQTAVMWAWHAPALYDAAVRTCRPARPRAPQLPRRRPALLGHGAGRGRRHAAGRGVPGHVRRRPARHRPGRGPHPRRPRPGTRRTRRSRTSSWPGVVMWGFAGTVYVVAAGVVFGLWLAAAMEPRRRPASRSVEQLGWRAG